MFRGRVTPLTICAGPVPEEIGNMSALQNLWLQGNQFSGDLRQEEDEEVP